MQTEGSMSNQPRASQSTLDHIVAFRVLAAIGIVSSHCLLFQTPASLATPEVRALLLLRDFGVSGFFLIGGVFLARAGYGIDYLARRWKKILPPTLAVELVNTLFLMGGTSILGMPIAWASAFWLWFIYYYLAALAVVVAAHRCFGIAGVWSVFAAGSLAAIAFSAASIDLNVEAQRVLQAAIQVPAGAFLGILGIQYIARTPIVMALFVAAAIVGFRIGAAELPLTALLQTVYALAVFALLPPFLVRLIGCLNFKNIRSLLFQIFLIHGFVAAALSAGLEAAIWGKLVPGKLTLADSLLDMALLWVATTIVVIVFSAALIYAGHFVAARIAGVRLANALPLPLLARLWTPEAPKRPGHGRTVLACCAASLAFAFVALYGLRTHDDFARVSNRPIVVIGSSTAAGVGATAGQSWFEQMRRMGYSMSSQAVAGSTLSDAIRTGCVFNGDCLPTAQRPILIVHFPTNDIATGRPPDEVLESFRWIADWCTDRNIDFIFASIQPRNLPIEQREALRSVDRMLADQYPDRYVSVYKLLATRDGRIHPHFSAGDQIHVVDAAHAAIAQELHRKILQISATQGQVPWVVAREPSATATP